MGISWNFRRENKKKQPLLPIQVARSAPPTNPPTSISPHSTQFSPLSHLRRFFANLRRRISNHLQILSFRQPPSSPPSNLPDRIYPPPPSSLPRTHTVDRYHRPMTVRPNNPAYQNTEGAGSHPEAPPRRDGAGSDSEDPRPKDILSTVNIRKETITIELDEQNPDSYLVSFVFDAMLDGSISISYVAVEGGDNMFRPLCIGNFHFKKGHGQRYRHASGTGVNLSTFDMYYQLLVIRAETCLGALQMDQELDQDLPATCAVGQITVARLEKNNEDHFQVGEVKQILRVNGFCAEDWYDNNETEKECAICRNGLKNTAILPCRHYSMCRDCATTLMYESNKCPICREPINQLVQINDGGAFSGAGHSAG